MGQLCLALLALLSCTNAEILRYEMLIAEEPVKIVQVVTFDEEAGLRLVEVPKHRHLMKTLHVADLQDRRLSLEVVEELEVCYIGKPRRHLDPKEEQEALGNFTQMFDSHKVFSSSQAVHMELLFLAGAHITHNELPPKLKPYCPPDYSVQTFRYIEKEKQVVTGSKSGEMIVQDPTIQRNYSEGDYLMTEEDNLPEGLNLGSRHKRAPTCRGLDSNGRLSWASNGCFWVNIACDRGDGCPASHVYYKCNSTPVGYRSCEYILLCATIHGKECAVHATSSQNKCVPCCISDNCGTNMPKCSGSRGGVSSSGRKLIMKINMRKEIATNFHDNDAISNVAVFYKGKDCLTSILPSRLPNTGRHTTGPYTGRYRSHTVQIDMQSVLGTCFGFDVSGGIPDTMRMELKLGHNSPISVSKVKVIDQAEQGRCWVSQWKGAKNNQQTGVFISGSSSIYDDDCYA